MNFELSATYTDLYQLAMGQAYQAHGLENTPVTFDYFFRKIPYQGGYVVFAGLADILNHLASLRFTAEDIQYLSAQGFAKDYLQTLQNFKFNGSIYAPAEGDLIFPTAPVLRVEGTMLETQLIETALLNILNYESLIATKAARIRSVAPDKILSEFGLRRAQGPGGILASRAAIIGGFDSTSNVHAAKEYRIKCTGTMAHSFVQMYGDECAAFRSFASANPHNCILLVDTYNTLKSGVPNAIKVAKEMEKKGEKLFAVRLDSGDLSYLSRKTRQLLDQSGLQYVKIAASNQLDEYVIRSLMQQKAPIDIFGVGTNLVTGKPNAALDGVYKLVMADKTPRIKVSDNIEKTTLPGQKQVYRLLDEEGGFIGTDAVTQINEPQPHKLTAPFDAHKSKKIKEVPSETLLQPVMKNGEIINSQTDIHKIQKYAAQRLAQLPDEFKRFENPHIYKVGISPETQKIRNTLRAKYTDL